MASSYLGSAITKGLTQIPGELERRQEAKQRQELGQLKLDAYKKQEPVRDSRQELEMQELKNQLRKSQSQGLQQLTYEAFNSFDSDGEVRHLNNFLQRAKQNPIGQQMFSSTTRYDAVERTKETEQMLRNVGITDIDGYFENPSEAGNYVLATTPEGEKKLLDMDKVYAMTGYTKMMQAQQLQDLNTRSLIAQRLRAGETKANLTALERVAKLKAEDEDIPVHEAYMQLKNASSKVNSTENERLAAQLQKQNPELSSIEAMEQAIKMKRAGSSLEREAQRIASAEDRDYNEVFEELKNQEERTTAQKSFEEINTVKDALDAEFDGSFLDADLSDAKQYSKAGRLIARIEKDFPLSVKDRSAAVQIRQLASLADVAGTEMTDAEAGPVDSLIRNTKKYLSNEVTGTKGTAAYEAFRNTLRHALYGSALSEGEIKAFNSAAGSLQEQFGPAMVKLRTQVAELQEKLTAVYDLNDEYVAKYRLNMSRDQIAQVVDALDERIDMISGAKPNKSSKRLTPGVKKDTIEEYFK